MTVILVVGMVLFFLVIDWLNQKLKHRRELKEMYFDKTVGLTMADGGEKISKKQISH